MKWIKILIVIGIFVFVLIVLPIKISAEIENINTESDIVEENESWLAQQLEIYGVPSAISAIISASGVGGVIWFVLKMFRRKNKEIVEGLKQLGLSSKALDKVISKLSTVEIKIAALECDTVNRLNEINDKKIMPLMDEMEKVYYELVQTKDRLHNGALKIINLLTNTSDPVISTEKEKV